MAGRAIRYALWFLAVLGTLSLVLFLTYSRVRNAPAPPANCWQRAPGISSTQAPSTSSIWGTAARIAPCIRKSSTLCSAQARTTSPIGHTGCLPSIHRWKISLRSSRPEQRWSGPWGGKTSARAKSRQVPHWAAQRPHVSSYRRPPWADGRGSRRLQPADIFVFAARGYVRPRERLGGRSPCGWAAGGRWRFWGGTAAS